VTTSFSGEKIATQGELRIDKQIGLSKYDPKTRVTESFLLVFPGTYTAQKFVIISGNTCTVYVQTTKPVSKKTTFVFLSSFLFDDLYNVSFVNCL
jgi:hypothetical protein